MEQEGDFGEVQRSRQKWKNYAANKIPIRTYFMHSKLNDSTREIRMWLTRFSLETISNKYISKIQSSCVGVVMRVNVS